MAIKKRRAKKGDGLFSVAFWQFMAFVMLVLVIWLNEVIDIAALWFGGSSGEPDIFRGCVLTVATMVTAIVTVGHTYVQQKQIIRGLLTVCAECRKIRVADEVWEQLDEYISEHSLALISHGLCPRCFEKACEEIGCLAGGASADKGPAA